MSKFNAGNHYLALVQVTGCLSVKSEFLLRATDSYALLQLTGPSNSILLLIVPTKMEGIELLQYDAVKS